MSQAPTPYTRKNNFTSDAGSNPNYSMGDAAVDLDAEYEAIRTSVNETISRLNEIQRDDGLLRQNIFDPADQIKLDAQQEAATAAAAAVASASAAADSATNAGAFASSASNSASSASASASAASVSAADAAAIYDYFDDRYLGVKASNPSVDNDGNALAVGTLYFNSANNEFRVYNGSGWQTATAGAFLNANTVNTFSGNGSQTTFTLSTPGSQPDTAVYINGVYQANSSYTVSGTSLTFSAAPPNGSSVEVQINSAGSIPDNSIALSKLQTGALPSAITVSTSNIVNGTITNSDISATAAIAGTKIGVISTSGQVANSATTATSSNLTDTIVLRDGSGDFAAGKITSSENEVDLLRLGQVLEQKATPLISGGQLSLNMYGAALFYVSLTQNITNIVFQNVPASPNLFSVMIQFVNDGTARTVAWPASVRWSGGVAPVMTGTNGKVDTFSLMTHDGGANWFAFIVDQNQ